MNNDVELIPVKGVSPSVQVQSDNVIYVPQAHKNKAGIVKEGDGVLIENGVVSLNRQTVEDMIDANKWVSYGFQQNLTEDEKGMARHNIGAGDNYFTGSYYDLTQKPHLNTNNTAGLDYGDEELNNTINLHKISKTGSFNDLKHVPQETLDFAESERQKSETDGAIVHEKDLIEKSMTLIDKIYVPNETYSQLRFDNLPGQYNYKLIVIGSVNTASDGSIKINDTDLKSITLSTNSDDTNVVNTFGDTALIRVDNRFRIDAEISVTDTYTGTPIIMEINNISSTSDTKIYGRKTSSTRLGAGVIGIKSITIDIGTSKFYRGTQAFLYKLGDKK